ncbi:C45 family autoproteolytic acyltransferase/hydolase [Dactylosporangium sp. CA-139066]|uniref:C45 family autoproteolytic acyltransferase/hydolase n=1 Tax=Dactylosporangium sp. CA-139066 TaxID=3239930 RepID=UPI003D949B20
MARTVASGYDIVTVTGDPDERGYRYGLAARTRIELALRTYADVFMHYASWDWPTVRRHGLRFAGPIEDFSPASAREIRAIALGAGVEVADILALNTRSEIMFAAPGRARAVAASECTSFALTPERTATGSTLMGQNWDWIEGARETAIVLQVRRDDGPDFITVVEAGMLAKVGINSSGVGLCTNTLISDGDEGRIGVPYHVLLRSVLDSDSGAQAVQRIRSTSRANSANYLIADAGGFCVDLETRPGDGDCGAIMPVDGAVTHANHFLVDGLTGVDRYLERKTHTRNRLHHLTARMRQQRTHTVESLQEALADHADAPDSVCQHPDATRPPADRTCTIAGIVMDLSARSLIYTSGSPCESTWSGPVGLNASS